MYAPAGEFTIKEKDASVSGTLFVITLDKTLAEC